MPYPNIAPEQSECLLRVVEAAPQVRRRHQYFVWCQGDFQRWLPHKFSVCGSYDRDLREVVFDLFNSLPVPEDIADRLKNARAPLMAAALQCWRRARYQACRLDLLLLDKADQAVRILLDMGYQHLLIHGVTRPGRPEELESFFVFGQPQGTYDDADILALEMLLPCLHTAYQRVCVTERQMVSARLPMAGTSALVPQQRVAPITEREREILLWVRDGLSNQQISEKLGISALTVKNHVQKILRKLGAANRAQAVAKAMTMNAFGAMPHGSGEAYY